MLPGRYLALEVLQRMREAEQDAETENMFFYRRCENTARARAFDEVYTQIKGLGLDSKII